MRKPVNHLASRNEKIANYRIPFQKRLLHWQQLTKTTRSIWQSAIDAGIVTSIPTALLASLQVIFYDGQRLTLSAPSLTAANHLNYHHRLLLQVLKQADNSFAQVQTLKFKVIQVNPVAKQTALTSPKSLALQEQSSNERVNNVTSCELSDTTKRNIAQLMTLVTEDKEISRVLSKLLT